jgi:hypothetical protein
LTAGEVALARSVFGAAIDYAKVRIFNRRYLPFQPRQCAMAPNGSIYFHRSRCLPDFAAADIGGQHWFIHEMTHVWQHQLGYPVRLRGALRLGLDYHYRLAPGTTLSDFNMEAQGDLLADYFALVVKGRPDAMRRREYAGQRALFEAVLAPFLADPASRAHLPRWRRASMGA